MRRRHLVGDAATVHLDLHDVCLLLAKVHLLDLSVSEGTDDGAVPAEQQ